MSLSIYCPNEKCCKANIYTLNKPKFCGFCGSSLESLGVVKEVKNKSYASRPIPNEEDDVDDTGEELDTSVDMDFQLDFKVEHVNDRQGVKLGDLAKAKKTGFGRNVKKLTKKSQKALVDDVLNEGKNSGKPIEIEDNSPE